MSLLITIAIIWLCWKLLKLSVSLLFWLVAIALVAFFVKILILPALLVMGGIFAYAFIAN